MITKIRAPMHVNWARAIGDGGDERIQEMLHGSDRVCAILGAAFLEYRLPKAIRAYLPRLDDKLSNQLLTGRNAPLNGLVASANLAHALGIFGPMCLNDIGKIAKIRNSLAHAKHHLKADNFEYQSIHDDCSNLALPENADVGDVTFDIWKSKYAPERNNISESRLRFEYSVSVLSVGLLFIGDLVPLERMANKEKPPEAHELLPW